MLKLLPRPPRGRFQAQGGWPPGREFFHGFKHLYRRDHGEQVFIIEETQREYQHTHHRYEASRGILRHGLGDAGTSDGGDRV